MTARKGWVAVALSLAIPGLGHVYAGAFGVAVIIGVTDRALPSLLELVAGAGVISVKTLAYAKLGLPLLTRAGAAAHAASSTRRPEPLAAPGAFAFFALGWVVLAFALGTVTAAWVTAVTLTEGGFGLRAEDRVLTTRFAEATPGALAVWFSDWPDGGQSPLIPTPRQARLGRVTAAPGDTVEIDGMRVPHADWGGRPLGVLSAPAPGGGLDWQRIGTQPAP